MEYIWIIQNSGSKMVDAFCFLVLNDVNMTLLLLLNTIYVLANVVILSNTPSPPPPPYKKEEQNLLYLQSLW